MGRDGKEIQENLTNRPDYGMIFYSERTSESAARFGQKRESGANPERSGHCKREAISMRAIAER